MNQLPDTDGYCRVSTLKQITHGHGLERYKEDLEDCGIPRDRIFSDVESGSRDDREGYNTVLERVRQGITKKVIVPCFDRFTRSTLHWEQVMEEFALYEAELHFTSGGAIDFITPDGRKAARQQAVDAAWWREKNQYAAKQGWARRRRKKKASSPPFGYKVENDVYVVNRDVYPPQPDKTYFDVAREIIETYLTEGSIRNTCHLMIQRYGVERYGSGWWEDFPRDRMKLDKWLKSPTVRGHLAYFGNRGKPQEIAQYNNHEAIIDSDEAQRIDQLLKMRASGISPSSAVQYPLSGLIYCQCGAKTSISGRKHRRRYYCDDIYAPAGSRTCTLKGGLLSVDAEQFAIAAICQRAAQEIATRIERSQTPTVSQDTPELLALRRKLAMLGDDPDFAAAIPGIQQKIIDLEAKQRSESTSQIQRREDLVNVGSDPEFFSSLSVEKRRFIYTQLINRVVKAGDTVLFVEFLGDLGTVRFDDRE
ncbi:MAG: recombinase family protein [Myxacorys californica WJT36-NPBG1]|jgi:DNA invertase Pin-like site-specific DNA recombinase|nr:recombinase family protein [Myxacorys californica WJT36-NPBG1]